MNTAVKIINSWLVAFVSATGSMAITNRLVADGWVHWVTSFSGTAILDLVALYALTQLGYGTCLKPNFFKISDDND